MDIKVDASNNIVKYPYFLTDLKVDNPKISFPRTALEDSDIRQQFNVLEVQDTSNPADDTHIGRNYASLEWNSVGSILGNYSFNSRRINSYSTM